MLRMLSWRACMARQRPLVLQQFWRSSFYWLPVCLRCGEVRPALQDRTGAKWDERQVARSFAVPLSQGPCACYGGHRANWGKPPVGLEG